MSALRSKNAFPDASQGRRSSSPGRCESVHGSLPCRIRPLYSADSYLTASRGSRTISRDGRGLLSPPGLQEKKHALSLAGCPYFRKTSVFPSGATYSASLLKSHTSGSFNHFSPFVRCTPEQFINRFIELAHLFFSYALPNPNPKLLTAKAPRTPRPEGLIGEDKRNL